MPESARQMVWSETRTPDGVEFAGWDPYSKPRGETAFDWFVVLSPIPVMILWIVAGEERPGFPYWCVVIPFALYLLSFWLRTYKLIVRSDGYRLRRYWFGLCWHESTYPPEAILGLEEDLFEPGVTGIQIWETQFGRGKHAEELLERIKETARALNESSARQSMEKN